MRTVRLASGVFLLFVASLVTLAGCPPQNGNPPVASFTMDITSGEAPLTIQFTDNSDAGDAPITEWTWNFGDGSSDNSQNPQHVYTNPGTYSVSLTVRNSFGTGTETKTDVITVEEAVSQLTIRISEFMASNGTTLMDEDGIYSDWIELHNYGTEALSLNGWTLTDDPLERDKWTFPDISLAADAYLIVFASDFDRRPTDGSNLHCPFRLSRGGEYLALFAQGITEPISVFAPTFPEQETDISYGYNNGQYLYFDTPTPGEANIGGRTEVGPPVAPIFSETRGYHNTSISLSLTTSSEDAYIRYTLDGTEPTLDNGTTYSTALAIDTNSVVRAASFRTGDEASEVVTHTFIISATAAELVLPALCIAASPTEALYEPNGVMAIVGGTYVADDEGIPAWTANGPADYNNPMQRGSEYERSVSFEFVDGLEDFQMNCGLRIHGGDAQRSHYRRSDNWTNLYEKFSFRFYFTDDYDGEIEDASLFPGDGATRHETLILRGGNTDQFNPFIKERMIREAAWTMGQTTARGRFVSLYINAEYKGYFELVERYDETYFRETFGVDSQWDIVDDGGTVEGTDTDWDAIVDYADANDLSVAANYAQVTAFLDIDAFIDHCIIELYGANSEWVTDNWLTARESVPSGLFSMYVTNAEATWEPSLINANGFINFPIGLPSDQTGLTQASGQLAKLYRGVSANAEFRTRFDERIKLHFGEGGALSQANLTNLFDVLRSEIEDAIPGFDTYIRDTWIPQREAIVLQQFEEQGLYVP